MRYAEAWTAKPTPTDLTDEQGALLEPLLPAAKPAGSPRSVDLREVVNALLYLRRARCAWRLLPQEFPVWQTVSVYFRQGEQDGTWERVAGALRRDLRAARGRAPAPSAAILDRQTVKTIEQMVRGASTPARRRPAGKTALG